MTDDSLLDDERITAFGRLVEVHSRLERLLGRELEAAAGLPLTWFEAMLRIARSPGGELLRRRAVPADRPDQRRRHVTRRPPRRRRARRAPDAPTDRRSQLVTLTDTGRAALERACAVHVRGLDEHLFSRLGPGDATDLARVLDALRQDG